MVGRTMAPKRCLNPMSGTCVYIMLHVKGGIEVASGIRLSVSGLQIGDYPGLAGWAPCHHKGS